MLRLSHLRSTSASVMTKRSFPAAGHALDVVALHAKTLSVPREKERPRGSVITPSMTEGVLLTSLNIRDILSSHAELKAMPCGSRVSSAA
jgi:hypothetical protein